MSIKITLIPGDGTGPELISCARKCLEALNLKFSFDEKLAGESAQEKYGNPLPEETIESIKKNKIALKGPTSTPIGKGFRSVNVGIRKELGLFANVRPAKTLPGVKTKFDHLDLVTVRENLEDLYSGIEFEKGQFKHEKVPSDAAVSLKVISEKNSKQIIDFAFKYAAENKRKKVSCVHKANILKFTDGMFLDIFNSIAKKYPKIESQDVIVDNMAMQLVQKPELYDVLVCPNLYGDIISDLCSGLVGGLGVAPSANLGKNIAVFEPVHGSAPKYAKQDKVNPTATILSAALMLKHLNKTKEAQKLENSVAKVIQEGKYVTYDLAKSSPSTMSRMTEEIIKNL